MFSPGFFMETISIQCLIIFLESPRLILSCQMCKQSEYVWDFLMYVFDATMCTKCIFSFYILNLSPFPLETEVSLAQFVRLQHGLED